MENTKENKALFDLQKNIMVAGTGEIGVPIAYFLEKLGHKVSIIDNDMTKISKISLELQSKIAWYKINEDKNFNIEQRIDLIKPELVISALPYNLNFDLFKLCYNKNINYVDLGGSKKTTTEIENYCNSCDSANRKPPSWTLTDLGLAPGWLNIEAEQMMNEHGRPEEVLMYCGGNPIEKKGLPLLYSLTWSADGLINEYFDENEIITNHSIDRYEIGMYPYNSTYSIKDNYDRKESFCTSGALSHSLKSGLEKNLKTLRYETIRWYGHRDLIAQLKRNLNNNLSLLKNVIKEMCPPVLDQVEWKIIVRNENKELKKSFLLKAAEGEISALSKTTAAGLVAAVQSLFYQNWTLNFLTYKDIFYPSFNSNLNCLLKMEVKKTDLWK